MHGEYQDAGGGIPLPNAPYRFNAAESRHGEIHDDEVGPCLLEQAVGFGAVARLGQQPSAAAASATASDSLPVRSRDRRQT